MITGWPRWSRSGSINTAVTGVRDDYWLASLEPEWVDVEIDKGLRDKPWVYGFRHITDLYGRLAFIFQDGYDFGRDELRTTVEDYWDSSDGDRVSFRNLRARIINPSAPIIREGDKADADGDGVADSRWVILPDMKTHKGEDIYAAIRIVDNGGMLNVNTAFMNTSHLPPDDIAFDANTVDGSSQMQINLMALAARGTNLTPDVRLQNIRCGSAPRDILSYDHNVVWRYNRPAGEYTPFDISDELELRNRYIINYDKMTARIELLWKFAYADFAVAITQPRGNTHDITDPCDWFWHANNSSPKPLMYDYHHISTTYNMDRIIDPAGQKMFNVNDHNNVVDISAMALYRKLQGTIGPGLDQDKIDLLHRTNAQLAVNLVDFADSDTDVTQLDTGGRYGKFYGFEAQPFITELGMKIDQYPERGVNNFYAVELYNPFDGAINLNDFLLLAGDPTDADDPTTALCNVPLGGITLNPHQSLVVSNNPDAFYISSADPCNPPIIAKAAACLKFFDWQAVDPGLPPTGPTHGIPDKGQPRQPRTPSVSYPIYLVRMVGGAPVYLDRQPPGDERVPTRWPLPKPGRQLYLSRDINDWHIVYPSLLAAANTLGMPNPDFVPSVPLPFSLALPNPYHFQRPYKPALAANPRQQLITIGDIPRVLKIGPGTNPAATVGRRLLNTPIGREYDIRLDLHNPLYSNIFQFITVFDPAKDNIDNDGDNTRDELVVPAIQVPLWPPEFKVPGRININTAPWFVIAQLPWVSPELARAIVAYRDKQKLLDAAGTPVPGANYSNRPGNFGYESIGQLNFVENTSTDTAHQLYRIQQDHPDGENLLGFPDLTPDNIVDDFEERDVIFSRISNLISVRSDVFTAYILVRIGRDGPQKRMVAILDRSDVYPSGTHTLGKVKIRALHPVADPR